MVWKSVDIQGRLETVVQQEIIENNLSVNNKKNLQFNNFAVVTQWLHSPEHL